MNKIDVVYIPTHGTKEEWETVNPLVPEGALCTETDTGKIKVGDGKKRWRDIPYAIGEPGAQGKAFRFEDFTEEQLNALKIKGDKGESAFELWQKQHPEGSVETFLSQLNVSIENAEKLGGRAASDYALLSGVETLVSDAERKIGSLSDLQTEEKTSLVAAINELTKGPGILPGNVKNIRVQAQNGKLLLRWEDPEDVLLGGSKLTRWAGTKVVYKTGAHPVLETDGTLAVDSKVRNQYRDSTLEITGLTNGTTYYIQIIPYNDKGQSNLNPENRISAAPFAAPPDNVSELSAKPGIHSVTVTWSDPETSPPVTWDGTMIRYKAGSMIQNEHDGTLAVDSKVRDQYRENGFTIGGLSNGTEYWIQAFPYSTDGSVNGSVENMICATPKGYRTMGVEIDYNNSNPETAVKYIEDAVSMTSKSPLWDDFFGYYPCMLKDGVEGIKLNPDDYTKSIDGQSVDITSGAQGDVMICFPKRGYKIETVDNGNKVRVYVTDDPNKEGFMYYAHQRGNANKDKLYIGAYVGYAQGGKLRSLSGKTPTVNQTIGTFRNQATAGGAGYDLFAFYPLVLLQCMGILRMKRLDSQTAFGKGWTNQSAATTTGKTNAKGMNWGEQTGKHQVKFLGIEDFWGNVYQWIDGLYCNSNRDIMTATQNFNESGSGYANRGRGASRNFNGWISKVQGTSETGFIIKENSGSQTTYFLDYGHFIAGCRPVFGGDWSSGAYAGLFMLFLSYFASSSISSIGARLMFL